MCGEGCFCHDCMEPTTACNAANMWNEALNKRLRTQNLSLPVVLVEVEKRGSSFAKLLTIPEQDDWVYIDGKSTSCVAFILEMFKEAGLFGELASSIQVTEFTVSLYALFCTFQLVSRAFAWYVLT
ncbi:hypothetical protein K7X08_032693 [Anisodus acutangulus]|uniref:Uncharacterized protein n=1 Tax=Anisodus acutangulus TaxID=402998 RepID=A0A9Q1MY95_9SOLA|nr:hypothetical protein K7X08_032693 [Anisodus acutangulus]